VGVRKPQGPTAMGLGRSNREVVRIARRTEEYFESSGSRPLTVTEGTSGP